MSRSYLRILAFVLLPAMPLPAQTSFRNEGVDSQSVVIARSKPLKKKAKPKAKRKPARRIESDPDLEIPVYADPDSSLSTPREVPADEFASHETEPSIPPEKTGFRTEIAKKGWFIGLLGFKTYRYAESGRIDFSQAGLTVGVDGEKALKSGLIWGGFGEFGMINFSNSGAPEAPKFLRLGARGGYRLGANRWQYGILGGLTYETMLSDTRKYGIDRVLEPVLTPNVTYYLKSTSFLRAEFTYGQVVSSPFQFSDRELEARLFWATLVGRKKFFAVMASYSNLRATIENANVNTSELALKVAYGW